MSVPVRDFRPTDRPSFSDVALATSIAEEEEDDDDSNGNNVSGEMPAIFSARKILKILWQNCYKLIKKFK